MPVLKHMMQGTRACGLLYGPRSASMRSAERLWGLGAVQGAAVLLGRALLYFCRFESSHLRAWTLFIVSDQIMQNSVSVKLVEVSHTARKR